MEASSSPVSAKDEEEIKQVMLICLSLPQKSNFSTIGWFDMPFEMREMVMEHCGNHDFGRDLFMITREYLEGVLKRFKDEDENSRIMTRGADLPVNPHIDEPEVYLSRRIFVITAKDQRIRDKDRTLVYHEDTLIEHWALEVELIQREVYVERTDGDVYRVNEFGLMAPECRERRNEVVLHPQGKSLVPAPNKEYLSPFIPIRNARQFSTPINYVITYYRECYSVHQKNFMNWVHNQKIPRHFVSMSPLNCPKIEEIDDGEPSTIIVEEYQQDEEQLALFNVPFVNR